MGLIVIAEVPKEDIEDGGSLDPHVSDLLNYTNVNAVSKSSYDKRETNKFGVVIASEGARSSVNGHFNEDGLDICDDIYSDLDLLHSSIMKEKDLGTKEDWSYLSEILPMDRELEEGEIASKPCTDKETHKSVLTAGHAARSFVNGLFKEDDEDICDDTYSDLDFFHSSMNENDLGGNKGCTYLGEVLPVDEELEEGEIA